MTGQVWYNKKGWIESIKEKKRCGFGVPEFFIGAQSHPRTNFLFVFIFFFPGYGLLVVG